jgi:hypothetical protein
VHSVHVCARIDEDSISADLWDSLHLKDGVLIFGLAALLFSFLFALLISFVDQRRKKTLTTSFPTLGTDGDLEHHDASSQRSR